LRIKGLAIVPGGFRHLHRHGARGRVDPLSSPMTKSLFS
jgi:hypothetical protein